LRAVHCPAGQCRAASAGRSPTPFHIRRHLLTTKCDQSRGSETSTAVPIASGLSTRIVRPIASTRSRSPMSPSLGRDPRHRRRHRESRDARCGAVDRPPRAKPRGVRVIVPSASYRQTTPRSARSNRATSSATVAKILSAVAWPATRVATWRSAACSSASRLSSNCARRHSINSSGTSNWSTALTRRRELANLTGAELVVLYRYRERLDLEVEMEAHK
jgi:hypothetical protein